VNEATEARKNRARAEQKWVVLSDGNIYGTQSGGPLTRDAAWLLERWFKEAGKDAQAVKLVPTPEEYNNG
jgi:hypothetical protein